MTKYNKTPTNIKVTVLKKMLERFFKPMEPKLSLPNIFTVTVPQKRTVLFIKKVSKEYRSLMTAMLFNLKASSVLCGDGTASALIVDSSNGEWYNKALLEKACSEAGSIMNNSVGTISVVNSINPSESNRHDQLWLYVHSNDQTTKEIIYKKLTVEEQFTCVELDQIKQKHFGGQDVPESILTSAPITMTELEKKREFVIIDTSKRTRPFICG
jgi:hypothetical protein